MSAGLSGTSRPRSRRDGFRVHAGIAVLVGATIACGSAIWELEIPIGLIGLGNALIASPVSTAAIRNLPLSLAGAGSGGCNAIRQRGAVLGDASIAAVTQAGLKTDLPAIATALRIHEAYATAMEQSLFLPASVLILEFIAVLFFELTN